MANSIFCLGSDTYLSVTSMGYPCSDMPKDSIRWSRTLQMQYLFSLPLPCIAYTSEFCVSSPNNTFWFSASYNCTCVFVTVGTSPKPASTNALDRETHSLFWKYATCWMEPIDTLSNSGTTCILRVKISNLHRYSLQSEPLTSVSSSGVRWFSAYFSAYRSLLCSFFFK